MNAKEYIEWRLDVYHCLGCKYSSKEITIIVEWFDLIKGKKEAALIGPDRLEAYRMFNGDPDTNPHYNLYDSMMIRVWAYAPAILKAHNESK